MILWVSLSFVLFDPSSSFVGGLSPIFRLVFFFIEVLFFNY